METVDLHRPADLAADIPRFQRLTLAPALALHLLPAAATVAAALALAPAMVALHLPETFAVTVAFALVLTPTELGLLLRATHRATGTWSLRRLPTVLAYRRPLGRWWLLVPPLFAVALALAVGWTPLGNAIGDGLSGAFPHWMLPDYDDTTGFAKPVLVVTMLCTLLVDGLVNPIVEELYFRGYLLPRLPVAGWRAVPLSAALFAVQHYWQPYNWVLIFGLELILTALVVRSRSVRLGMVMHVLANTFGVVVALIGVLA